MTYGLNPNSDFRMVRKRKPRKARAIPHMSEAMPRGIILAAVIPQAKGATAGKPPHSKARPVKQADRTLPAGTFLRPRRAFSFAALAPAVAGFIIITLLVHSGSYLTSAKDASGVVLGAATSAYEDLDAANKSLESQDFGSAAQSFGSAQSSLLAAQSELEKFKALMALAPPARSADSVLTGAYFLAEAGKNLVQAMQLFDDLSVDRSGITSSGYADRLKANRQLLANSLLMLDYADRNFDAAGDLPGNFAETLDHARGQVSTLKSVLKDLLDLGDLFLSFFGDQPKTYLLVFQNYDEMRATGGFIGTYGVLRYNNGQIEKLKIQSVYDLDGSLTKQIAAPGPFQPEIRKWGMRDANWFADFPTTARKLLEFFEYGSETADGVIAMTPYVFSEILKLVGPIEMPAYGVTLTADNFQDIVQLETSVNYDRKLNQPKKFLDDFTPVLLDRMSTLQKEEWFAVFQILQDTFLQKHMLIYSGDVAVQGRIAAMGYDGRLLQTDGDYLSIVNSNHGGTKTDLDIRQSVSFRSEFSQDGSIVNTVKITRDNTADERNLNFMRILVPEGSRLISARGFLDKPQYSSSSEGYDTDPDLAGWDGAAGVGNTATRRETGKTAFSGWTESPAAGQSEVVLTYELPFRLNLGFLNRTDTHSLVFQKQSGSLGTELAGEWALSGQSADWLSDNAWVEGRSIKFESDGMTDELFGASLTK